MKTISFTIVAVLTFVRGASAQLVEINIALGKPTAGDVAFGYPTSNGNDGNTATFNHADNINPAPNNPFWTVDFQAPFSLTKVEIVDRIGCCDPNRLNGSEIRILDINGAQIGATLLVEGLPPSSPDLVTATRTFTNGAAGWPGAASVRIDGYTQYFQFSEFRAFAMQPPLPPMPVNVAPTGIATASGALWPGLGVANIIDNDPGTVSHPQAAAGETLGFTYTVNLFSSYAFERLELVNRSNCCPDRLRNYRVSLHEDNGGAPGPAVWTADLRTDGTDSGMGGIDLLTAGLNPAGTFAGQFIRVENLSNEAYNPQIAELRAFSFPPQNLASGKPVGCYDASDNPVGTWGGFPASNLVDGAPGTFSHPLEQFSAGYYFQIDLGAETAIGEVKLNGRLDGCCPERLNNARLEIRDGSSNTVFGREVTGQVTTQVVVDTGGVTGRFLRIVNADGATYGPQVGEVIVHPPTGPEVPFQILSFDYNSVAGTGSVTFSSKPGATYALFGSSNLAAWSEIEDNISSDGLITEENFTDPGLIGAARRYYRVDKLP